MLFAECRFLPNALTVALSGQPEVVGDSPLKCDPFGQRIAHDGSRRNRDSPLRAIRDAELPDDMTVPGKDDYLLTVIFHVIRNIARHGFLPDVKFGRKTPEGVA